MSHMNLVNTQTFGSSNRLVSQRLSNKILYVLFITYNFSVIQDRLVALDTLQFVISKISVSRPKSEVLQLYPLAVL
jgi:hypothetical protein